MHSIASERVKSQAEEKKAESNGNERMSESSRGINPGGELPAFARTAEATQSISHTKQKSAGEKPFDIQMDQLHVVGQSNDHTIASGLVSQPNEPANANNSEKATIGSFLPQYPNQPETNPSATATEEKEVRRQVFTQDSKQVVQHEDRADQFFLTGVNVTT